MLDRFATLIRQLQAGSIAGQANAGVANVAYTPGAAGARVNSATIPHGLTDTPHGALGMVIPGGIYAALVPIEAVALLDAANIQFQHANNSGGALGAGNVTIAWLAWV